MSGLLLTSIRSIFPYSFVGEMKYHHYVVASNTTITPIAVVDILLFHLIITASRAEQKAYLVIVQMEREDRCTKHYLLLLFSSSTSSTKMGIPVFTHSIKFNLNCVNFTSNSVWETQLIPFGNNLIKGVV